MTDAAAREPRISHAVLLTAAQMSKWTLRVARLVGFDGMPAALPEEEIEGLRRSLGNSVWAEPHPYLAAGRRVRVIRGPLAGMEGVLRRRKGSFRLVISIELIQRSVVVDADAADIEAVSLPSRIRRCPASPGRNRWEIWQ